MIRLVPYQGDLVTIRNDCISKKERMSKAPGIFTAPHVLWQCLLHHDPGNSAEDDSFCRRLGGHPFKNSDFQSVKLPVGNHMTAGC